MHHRLVGATHDIFMHQAAAHTTIMILFFQQQYHDIFVHQALVHTTIRICCLKQTHDIFYEPNLGAENCHNFADDAKILI